MIWESLGNRNSNNKKYNSEVVPEGPAYGQLLRSPVPEMGLDRHRCAPPGTLTQIQETSGALPYSVHRVLAIALILAVVRAE